MLSNLFNKFKKMKSVRNIITYDFKDLFNDIKLSDQINFLSTTR